MVYVATRGEALSDEFEILKTGGTTLAAGGVVGALMRWLAGREAREAREAQEKAREEFVLLRADVKRLIDDVGEHKKVFEDVVNTKQAVKTLGEKFDDTKAALARVEERLGRLEHRSTRK